MRALVRRHGWWITVVTAEGTRYQVPRHYIALHGLTARELPRLARRYRWPSQPPGRARARWEALCTALLVWTLG